jgi:anti-sigma B factor antagonist
VGTVNSGPKYVGRFRDQVAEKFVGDQELSHEIRISIRPGGAHVLEAIGDIDMLTAPALDKAIAENLHCRPPMLIIDLSGVTFLASSGLASLMSALEGCRAEGAALRLVCPGQLVLRPMELTGLIKLFDVYPSLESALRDQVGEVG